MKVSAFVPFFLASTAFAASRRSHDVLSARQVQSKRGLVDICASVDLDLSLLEGHLLDLHLDACLCVNLLPEFCSSDPVGKNATDSMGHDNAVSYFKDIIHKRPDKKQCQYPEHCNAECKKEQPCYFTCKDGYTADDDYEPTKCECKYPYTECNGKCGDFPNGCSSQASSHRKRDGIPECQSDEYLCGHPSGDGSYECVKTNEDLESCGGCMVPNPWNIPVPMGRDCSSIGGVGDVMCRSGGCEISSCQSGYYLSGNRDACMGMY